MLVVVVVVVVSCVQGEGISDLAITASKNALELAGVDGADIDLVSARALLQLAATAGSCGGGGGGGGFRFGAGVVLGVVVISLIYICFGDAPAFRCRQYC